MKFIYSLFLLFIVQGCGAIKYTPEEYPIDNERVDNLNVNGVVSVINKQDDESEIAFVTGERPFLGNLKAVTEQLKTQLDKEIRENSSFTNSSEKKQIKVKVTHLEASFKQTFRPLLPLDFYSEIILEFELGNGFKDKLEIPNKAPSNYNKVLNGAIALGVIEILKHPKVRNYLEQ